MKLFRDYTFAWWQAGLLKVYVLSIGLLIGAYFPDVVMRYQELLIGIFVVLAIYFIYALVTQKM